ncbi:C4-dicarboxylate TRAP transporter substrate-binding protein [Arthrobacter sp. Sr33]
MLKKKLAPAAVLATAALLLTACGGGDQGSGAGGETFELKLASYQPPTAAEPTATEQWAERIEEETDGRVSIEFFYQEALLPGAETLQGVADGRADMGYIADAYYPAQLPLTNVAGLPFVTESPEAQGKAFAQLYKENEAFKAEWDAQGVHVLTWAPVPPNVVAVKEKAESLKDLEGQQIRAIGYSGPAFEMAGMSPVAISQSEVYEALQRGVLSGTSGGSFDILTDRDYQEVAPHFMDLNSGNYAVTMNVINQDIWDSMPEDIQGIINEASADYTEIYIEALAEQETAACEELIDAGGTVTILTDEQTADWEAEAKPAVLEQWMDDASSNSDADPQAFYDAYTAVLSELEADATYEPALQRCAAEQ